MQPIPNPAKTVWYNKSHKVSEARCGHFLKAMLEIVGINADCFSNKSGRATLVTKMATLGVPNEIGMMITGHHTVDGYSRYDRTQDLKKEAANLVSRTPHLSWNSAMDEVSKKFLENKYVGSVENLKPLMAEGTKEDLALTLKQKKVRCLAFLILAFLNFFLS
jgi:hypothetical protein